MGNNNVQYSKKKTKCLSCGKMAFAPLTKYFDSTTINPATDGKCFSCGLFNRPTANKQFNKQYPRFTKPSINVSNANKNASVSIPDVKINKPVIDVKYLQRIYNRSFLAYQELNLELSNFHKFLININDKFFFHLRRWHVGIDNNGNTIYWFLDKDFNICFSKCFTYGVDGKRNKKIFPLPQIYDTFGLVKFSGYSYNTDILFGEHFLNKHYSYINPFNDKVISYSMKSTVMLVESEKSAVIGSFIFPQHIWLSYGGATNLTIKKAEKLRNRIAVLLIDNDKAGFDNIDKNIQLLKQFNCKCIVKNPAQIFGIDGDGIDVADCLLSVLTSNLREAV